MTPEEVPNDLVIKAAKAVYRAAEHQAECDGSIDSGDWEEWDPDAPFFSDLLADQRIALAAVLPEVQAQALRDAADALYGDERAKGPLWHPLSVRTWLRERASAVQQ